MTTFVLAVLEEAYQFAQGTSDWIMTPYAIHYIGFARHVEGKGAGAYAAMAEPLRLQKVANFVPGIAMSLHSMA